MIRRFYLDGLREALYYAVDELQRALQAALVISAERP